MFNFSKIMNEKKGKSVDPGWNDPPMINYTASNPPPKSRITNKRIAFPLNNTPGSTSKTIPSCPLPPPFAKSLVSRESTLEHLSTLLNSEESREKFSKIWNNESPEQFQKTVHLMTSCLIADNKDSAELHKQTLLSEYETLCDGWLKDVTF